MTAWSNARLSQRPEGKLGSTGTGRGVGKG